MRLIYNKIMLRKRSNIEPMNDMLKNVAQLVHPHHRSVHDFLMNLLAAIGTSYFFIILSSHIGNKYAYPFHMKKIYTALFSDFIQKVRPYDCLLQELYIKSKKNIIQFLHKTTYLFHHNTRM